jgi:hypothetical protein
MRRFVVRLGVLGLSWLALTGGVFSGCRGLFTPSVPEPPSGPPLVVNYNTVLGTLNTMAAGIARKSQDGSSAYLGAFSDGSISGSAIYKQTFDPGVIQRCNQTAGCSVSVWDYGEEVGFYAYLIGLRPTNTYTLNWQIDVARPDPPSDGVTAEIHRHYQVVTLAPDGNTTDVVAIGYADMIFTKIASKWQITQWDDRVDPLIGVYPTNPEQLSLGARRLESPH